MADAVEFHDVGQENSGHLEKGRLKVHNDQISFKNTRTGKAAHLHVDEISSLQWIPMGSGGGLRILMNNGSLHRFGGLRESDKDKMKQAVKNQLQRELEEIEYSMRGWNWGETDFEGNVMTFKVHDKPSFEIPLQNVSRVQTSKNEVTLEFHQRDETPESMVEIRFHIPTPEGNDERIQTFQEKVLSKASVIQAAGDALCIFTELQCLTPRGRYDFKVYPSFIQLHGKTFDYKIPYTTIVRLFLLPHADTRQMFFVISLDPPIKQGQTRYHFVILVFLKEDELTVEMTFSEKDEQKYKDKHLDREMSGPAYEMMARLMKALTERKITVPGTFQANGGVQCVSCAYKAVSGYLYPLERGFLYVHKPPIYIRFDEVGFVNFARSSGSNRSFDIDVEVKNGVTYSFNSIDKDEYTKLFDFMTKKQLNIKNRGMTAKTGKVYHDSGSEDSDGDHDAYLSRMKKEGRERAAAAAAGDSDEETSDEDFNPDVSSEGSHGSVAEEYDTDAASSSSDGEGGDESTEKKKKKKTITVPEPALDGKGADSDDEGDGEDRPRKKPKKKTSSAGGGGRQKKPPKDPNAPKRPMSAYMAWFQENRERMKRENPEAGMTELSKVAGQEWKTVGADEKEKYDATYKEEAVKYKETLEKYKQSSDYKDHRKRVKDAKKGGGGKSPKKSRAKAKAGASAAESSAGAGAGYKSKEYISSSSSSGSEGEDKPQSKKARKESASEEESSAEDSD